MAQHKVPQDVEADDKLLGPFTFRQFVYLLIAIGSAALAVALFQIFPVLAILPVPFVLFFGVLALPLRRDQPMETYLAAVATFYLKPRRRVWMPGQRETTIVITAPKVIEQPRTRNLSEEEASRRLSFLADIVDSEGLSIRNGATYDIDNSVSSNIQDDVVAEVNSAPDMLDAYSSANINRMIENRQTDRRTQLLNQMKTNLEQAENPAPTQPLPPPQNPYVTPPQLPQPDQSQLVQPQQPIQPLPQPAPQPQPIQPAQSIPQPQPIQLVPQPQPIQPIQPTPQPEPAQQPQPTPQPQSPQPDYHTLQLAEMRDLVQKSEAAHNYHTPVPIDHNHIDYTPTAVAPGPDYSSAMDAILHPENLPTPSQSTPTSPLTPAAQPAQPNPTQNPPLPSSPTPTLQTSAEPLLSTEPQPAPPSPARTVPSARFINLASNQDYTIETIQKEANRIKKADEAQEVFISLH